MSNLAHDIVFIGNSSIDSIHVGGRQYREVPGGSAPSAAVAASCFAMVRPAVLSCLGQDYPFEAFGPAVDFSPCAIMGSTSRFAICEPTGTFTLESRRYLSLPALHPIPPALHTHLSCRAGVDIDYCYSKVRDRSLSIDVMASSIHALKRGIADCLGSARMLFCNREEFKLLDRYGLLPSGDKVLILSTGSEAIDVHAARSVLTVPCVSLESSRIVSTVGAGDCFAGAFLAGFASGVSFLESMAWGIAAATISVSDIGVVHLLGKRQHLQELTSALACDLSISDDSPQSSLFRRLQSLLGGAENLA